MHDGIKDYFCLGDLHSAALVSKDASIDWLCLPHFDSPSIFGKILDENAGEFSIYCPDYSVSSEYIDNTAVVRFDFINKESEFILKDFMFPQSKQICDCHFLIRKFKGVKGKSNIKIIFNPKPQYALKKDGLNINSKKLNLKGRIKQDIIFLYPPKDSLIEKTEKGYEITFDLKPKEEKQIVLEYVVSGSSASFTGQDMEKETIKFWHKWVNKGKFFDSPISKNHLIRSAITLKLMQFYPTGAIVAAPTTSLPESIGGERNWDYRYVWIRDATFTLYALSVLGFREEANSFFKFIRKITEKHTNNNFDISLIYTIDGKPVAGEKILPHFSGYKYSQPVRIGNSAKYQFQLDTYGSLIDAYYFASKLGYKVDKKHKQIILNLARKIKEFWLKKDNSFWEVRSGREHFTYSKVMAWVGINRIIKMAEKLKLSKLQIKEYKDFEKIIHGWIWKNCFDNNRKTFKQYPKTQYQDATNLLFVLLQFLNKDDPLTKNIIEQTVKELSFNEVFVYRYFSDDGVKGTEGAFLLCSFWLISAWALLGETKKAFHLFSKLEKYIAPSGLLSEEINPDTGEYLGNFPQAFSHIGYIMSAYYLNEYSYKGFFKGEEFVNH